MKFFNTAGPIVEEDHYCLPPLSRIDFLDLMGLIKQKKYFVLHAPRQTGKTTVLLSLMKQINQQDEYRCLYVNVEAAQAARENVDGAMKTIMSMLGKHALSLLGDDFLEKNRIRIQQEEDPHACLYALLSAWAASSPKPLVLLIDEIDALVGDSLISVLRQLRTGYAMRPDHFPQSVVLCGVRDVRDYRIYASSQNDPITGGSAFNVKAESLRLGNFSEEETHTLLHEHEKATGQLFTSEAKSAIWTNSQGQPWLVNALAYEMTSNMKANRDPAVILTESMVIQARENLILRRETHLDQFSDKLSEPRVHRVIAPILAGLDQTTDLLDDDISYVEDLGLITTRPQMAIANPIYREVIPRMLTWSIQTSLSQESPWFISQETGLLDMPKLLEAFQQFFREHSAHWTERFQYKEAGPQLLLQAFLQRVINGGGRIEREYGLGRGRTDLLVMLFHKAGVQRIVLELKILKGKRQTTIDHALPQVTNYMDHCGADEGHLILFERSERKWEEKIFRDQIQFQGVTIGVWGM